MMIAPDNFFNFLIKNQIDFFTGVPDSLLKDICAYISDHNTNSKHIIAANEGNAIALATGHYLSSKKLSLVYMQNSGLGNAINPLTSLTNSEVYSIPIILMIGWRGAPNIKDEPQHLLPGQITPKILDLLNIDYKILDHTKWQSQLEDLIDIATSKSSPVAILVEKNTFAPYTSKPNLSSLNLSREQSLSNIIANLQGDEIIVSTTGKLSRELYEIREQKHMSHKFDFMTIGAMGHALSIASGIALNQPHKKVICFDGDGSSLMHMGSMGITASLNHNNLTHILFNNQTHQSVGGQQTIAGEIDYENISKGLGYKNYFKVQTIDELIKVINNIPLFENLTLIEIKINNNSRNNLGRPTTTPIENKEKFMEFLLDG